MDEDLTTDERAELERLRLAMDRFNRLRSNIVMTQNSSWSNTTYTLVAILNEAGYEPEGATEVQMQEHLHCYGGAGKTPRHLEHTPRPEQLLGVAGHVSDSHQMSGSILIHAERWRQVDEEGWDAEHDDEHDGCQLVMAAGGYIWQAIGAANGVEWPAERQLEGSDPLPPGWPWSPEWWKPSDDPTPNLVKAGALIAAEIDRLERAKAVVTDGD